MTESEKNTDHEAFLRLFTRFEGNLRAFVASLLPTWEGVDEVMQEVEPRLEGDERTGFDSVILAADRCTLLIEKQESPGYIDEIRLLVETN